MERRQAQRRMIVWMNGHFMAENDASIAITDRGLTLGDGVFDTMLMVDGTAIDADLHFMRLARHAAVMRMALDTAPLTGVTGQLLHRNGFTTGRHAIRTTITRGPGPRGIAPPDNPALSIIMRADPAPALQTAPRLITAQSVRRNEGSPLSRIKSLNYGDNVIAMMEAQAAGADDALMLNNAGNAACATASNIYVLHDGAWLTPRLDDGAMDGITRACLIDAGKVREAVIPASVLMNCESIALSNAITGLRPAITLDGRTLNTELVPDYSSLSN